MRLLSATTILLTSALATAHPTPNPSTLSASTRATTTTTCHRAFPSSTQRINLVNRPDLGLTTTQTVTFDLPREALADVLGPCTLRARFPPGWEVYDSRGGEPPLLVNVFALDDGGDGAILVGSVRFPAGVVGVGGGAATTVVINSFACRERMAFRLELAEPGEVGFVNGEDRGLGADGGVEMVWGC